MQLDKPVTFGEFRLDARNEQLWQGEQTVTLRPKAFAVLRHLVERRGQLVTKQQLLDAVWPGTFVTDAVLKDSVRQVRDALGDDPTSPQFIETAHRRGYRFIGRISEAPTARSDSGTTRAAHFVAPAPPLPPQPVRVHGRETELATIHRWLERALAGERQVVFVTGEPGIGKTTLVRAVSDDATARGMLLAWGQCLEHYGAGEAYLPILEGLSRLCR